jgi:membrane-associated phospholipid phosphatase
LTEQSAAHDGLAPTPLPESRVFSRLAATATAIYMVVLLVAMLVAGVWPTIDIVVLGVALAAALSGRGAAFVRDWLPFVLIFLGWEAMRGLADEFGATVQSDSVIWLERALSFGYIPTVELQRLLYRPDAVSVLDVAMSVIYSAHFVFPLGIAYVFWMRDRGVYYRFVGGLLAVALLSFVVYLLVPVSPPRFAHRYGEALPVVDIIGATIVKLDFSIGAGWIYDNLSPNDVAAFPSLHAAFPLLALMFVWRRSVLAALPLAAYTAAVWFGIVYLGHHYIVDIIGGAAFAFLGYAAVERGGVFDRLMAARRRGAQLAPSG